MQIGQEGYHYPMAGKNRIVINPAKNKQVVVSLTSANNQKVMTSETYKSKAAANKAVKAIEKIVKNPVVVDNTKPKPAPKKKA